MKLVTTDPQELFDLAVYYFQTKQGRCAVEDRPKYLTENGDRCVVGYLLELETQQDQWNLFHFHGGVDRLNIHMGLLHESEKQDVIPLLRALQELHDNPENWSTSGFTNVQGLLDVGLTFGLSVAKLTPELKEP